MHRDGAADRFSGLREASARTQRIAEIVPAAREPGIEPDSDRQRIDCALHVALVGKQDRERVAEPRITRVTGNRTLEVVDGAGKIARHFARLRAQRERGTNVVRRRAHRPKNGRKQRQRLPCLTAVQERQPSARSPAASSTIGAFCASAAT